MRITFTGDIVDEPRVRAGFIGCGSHAFRNIYPTFQFAPVELVATCDVAREKAEMFARQFGARAAYADHHEMLESESLDAIFIVLGLDDRGRPQYPDIAIDCLQAGMHVWMEKPPAATTHDITRIRQTASDANRQVMVGFKKMFFPANEHARRLTQREEFGTITQASTSYPQAIPTTAQLARYLIDGEPEPAVVTFLDHLCHPISTVLLLMGRPPRTLYYERARNGGGVALFTYDDGAVATVALTAGASAQDGLERTVVTGDRDTHVVVDNNCTVSLHRMPAIGYGDVPDFYVTEPDQAAAVWRPEFSLGQLYNKGLFLLGYYGEINEFAQAVLEHRPVAKAGLEDAWVVTNVFEAFAQGPGTKIELSDVPS